MTELTLDKLDYYLPSQYVFITTRGALVKTEVLEDKNIRPSATDPFNYRIPFIPGVPSVDSPIYVEDLNFEDNNSQGILGDPAQPKIKLVDNLLTQIRPQITAETGYQLYFSPVMADIPTSFYNIYNIDGLQGNSFIFIQIYKYPNGLIPEEVHYVEIALTQGNYTPNSFADEVQTQIEYWIDELATRTNDPIDVKGFIGITYRESSRKYKFENNLSNSIDNPVWEFRFFLQPYWQNYSTDRDPVKVSPLLCFTPLGLTIPYYIIDDPNIQDNLYIYDNKPYAYWRISRLTIVTPPFASNEFWSTRNIDLRRSTYIAMICNEGTNSSVNSEFNDFGDSNRILFNIPIPMNFGGDESIPSNLKFNPQDSNFKTNVSVLGITNFADTSLTLLDSNGLALNMNGVDWTMTLRVRQIPIDNDAIIQNEDTLDSFLKSLPQFNRDDPGSIKSIKPALNPAKLKVFRERLEQIQKKKGKIDFNSILNNLQGEKSQIYSINPDSGKEKVIPDISINDIGLEKLTPEEIAEKQTKEENLNN